jgi:hypothetical protein
VSQPGLPYEQSDEWLRCSYLFVYIFLLKNLAVYALDIYTAATMIASKTWTNVIYRKCGNDCAIKIPFDIAKWVFVGCIAFGFLLVSADISQFGLVPPSDKPSLVGV